MKKDDNAYIFRILDEVSKDAELTQRSLSQRLGVALGLTNLYLKRLVKKGFIKVVNIKPNRLRYELTPSGIAQKTSLAFKYIQDSYVFYREARRNLTHTFDRLKAQGIKSVVLYGTGDIAEIALLSFQEAGLDLIGIVYAHGAGQTLCGRPVLSLRSLASLQFDGVVVAEPNPEETIELLLRLGVDDAKIIRLGI